MFYGCGALKDLNVSNFDTSMVENMKCMFYKCPVVTLEDVSGFNTQKVTDCTNFMQTEGWESLFPEK